MSDLTDKLESIEACIKFQHVRFDSDDLQDHWIGTISYDDRHCKFPYRTGIGHRITALGVKKEYTGSGRVRYYRASDGFCTTDDRDAVEQKMLILRRDRGKLVGPDCGDFVSYLLGDAALGEDTFRDFCENCGCDTDSRKALESYLECQDILMELRRIFGHKTLEELHMREH